MDLVAVPTLTLALYGDGIVTPASIKLPTELTGIVYLTTSCASEMMTVAGPPFAFVFEPLQSAGSWAVGYTVPAITYTGASEVVA